MKTVRFFTLCAFTSCMLLFAFSSCKKDAGKSRLTVYLTDAPAAYDAVNVDIQALQIKSSSDDGENGWQTLPLQQKGLYNLLDFRNGMEALLSSIELPAGKVSQLRLILGDKSSITISGNTTDLPLETPSAQQSGVKLNIHADLVEGVEYKLWIDFDAARSIVVTGSNSYKLKPVIRTFTEATSGAIKGIVLPAEANAVVYAINGTDTMSALPNLADGKFLVRGVPAGTWKVLVDGNNNYNDVTIPTVNVVLGAQSDIGTVTLIK